jgi:hypothetical protein
MLQVRSRSCSLIPIVLDSDVFAIRFTECFSGHSIASALYLEKDVNYTLFCILVVLHGVVSLLGLNPRKIEGCLLGYFFAFSRRAAFLLAPIPFSFLFFLATKWNEDEAAVHPQHLEEYAEQALANANHADNFDSLEQEESIDSSMEIQEDPIEEPHTDSNPEESIDTSLGGELEKEVEEQADYGYKNGAHRAELLEQDSTQQDGAGTQVISIILEEVIDGSSDEEDDAESEEESPAKEQDKSGVNCTAISTRAEPEQEFEDQDGTRDEDIPPTTKPPPASKSAKNSPSASASTISSIWNNSARNLAVPAPSAMLMQLPPSPGSLKKRTPDEIEQSVLKKTPPAASTPGFSEDIVMNDADSTLPVPQQPLTPNSNHGFSRLPLKRQQKTPKALPNKKEKKEGTADKADCFVAVSVSQPEEDLTSLLQKFRDEAAEKHPLKLDQPTELLPHVSVAIRNTVDAGAEDGEELKSFRKWVGMLNPMRAANLEKKTIGELADEISRALVLCEAMTRSFYGDLKAASLEGNEVEFDELQCHLFYTCIKSVARSLNLLQNWISDIVKAHGTDVTWDALPEATRWKRNDIQLPFHHSSVIHQGAKPPVVKTEPGAATIQVEVGFTKDDSYSFFTNTPLQHVSALTDESLLTILAGETTFKEHILNNLSPDPSILLQVVSYYRLPIHGFCLYKYDKSAFKKQLEELRRLRDAHVNNKLKIALPAWLNAEQHKKNAAPRSHDDIDKCYSLMAPPVIDMIDSDDEDS